MGQVLITNLTAPDLLDEMVSRLEAARHVVHYEGIHPGWSEEAILRLVEGNSAVIAGGDEFSARVISRAPGLRIIARVGMGVDQVDIDAATEAHVMVTNTPGVATDAVADQTLGLLIAVVRNFPRQFLEASTGEYQPVFCRDLRGMGVGLVWCGRIAPARAGGAAAIGER